MRFPWSKPNPSTQDASDVLAVATESAVSRIAGSIASVFNSKPIGSPFTAPTKGVYGYDNPWTYATPQSPKQRPNTPVSVETLRTLSHTYDILRSCIQHIKREVSSVDMRWQAKDKNDSSKTSTDAVAFMNEFCGVRHGLGGPGVTRNEFESMLIEDMCVVGNCAIFYELTRGGGILQVDAIDAATIRPCMDAFGWPGPGEYKYQQWIYGMHVASLLPEQMDFRGLSISKMSYTPYYCSPVEWLVFAIESALRADQWNRAWLTDGNSASQMVTLGGGASSITPEQAQSWVELWDSIRSGNSRMRQKTAFLPGGSEMLNNLSRKDQDFQEFELWLLRRTCSIMGVQPASIGFAGEQYKVSQGDSMEFGSFYGPAPFLEFRKTFYDDLARRLGFDTIEVVNITGREEAMNTRATRNALLVNAGIKSRNEARSDEDLGPIDGGDEIFVQLNTVPLEVAMNTPAAKPVVSEPVTKTRAELGQWERKSLARLKANKTPYIEFASDVIPLVSRSIIEANLNKCSDVAAVKDLFAAAKETCTYNGEQL